MEDIRIERIEASQLTHPPLPLHLRAAMTITGVSCPVQPTPFADFDPQPEKPSQQRNSRIDHCAPLWKHKKFVVVHCFWRKFAPHLVGTSTCQRPLQTPATSSALFEPVARSIAVARLAKPYCVRTRRICDQATPLSVRDSILRVGIWKHRR